MGCPCGCQDGDQLSFDFEQFEPDPAQEAWENAVEAVTLAMNTAFEQGLRDGAKATVDVSEAVSEDSDQLSELVEADAVALDSVLVQVQDLTMRLESLEMHLGLKYTPA